MRQFDIKEEEIEYIPNKTLIIFISLLVKFQRTSLESICFSTKTQEVDASNPPLLETELSTGSKKKNIMVMDLDETLIHCMTIQDTT